MDSATAHHPPVKGYVFAGLIVLIWTGFILVSRAGGLSPLTAWDVMAIRYATASLILLPYWWLFHRINLRDYRLWTLATLGGIVYSALAYAGFKLTPAAHAAILLPGMQPFAIAVAAWLLLSEVPGRNRRIGLTVIAAGVACLAADTLHGSAAVFYGDLLMVGAALCWACYSVLLRRWSLAPLDATIAVTLITGLVYLPVYVAFLPKHLALASTSAIVTQAVYQGVMANIIQMLLFVRTVALIGPARLGLLMALIPALAGLAAVPLLHEPMSMLLLGGLVLVCLGAWIGNRRARS